MLSELNQVLRLLPDMLTLKAVATLGLWDSLVINRRKPHTFRAFHIFADGPLKGVRVCLHRFEACSAEEAFMHPHPWPSAMAVLGGRYKMTVGASQDSISKPDIVMETVLHPGSQYSMPSPLCWHSVQPLEMCLSVMVNGAPWGDKAHLDAPTTKGKDLEKMEPEKLGQHLGIFSMFVKNYLDVHVYE